MTPARANSVTSLQSASKGRLISGPRTAGTMQKAHELSQPTWIVTQAECGRSRRTASAEGKASASARTVSVRISTIGPSCAARVSNSAARCTLWVPNTTSTCGARARTRSWSFCARQPPTAICMSGRARLTPLSFPR